MTTRDDNKRSAAVLVAAALACGLAAGCSQAGRTQDGDPSVTGTYADLGAQLQNCVSSAFACLKDANCDTTKDQACRQTFMTCHDANVAAFQAFGKAVQTCWDDKHTCIADARGTGGAAAAPTGTGGSSAVQACHDEFSSCVSDAKPVAPPPDPCMATLKTCVMNATSSGTGGSAAGDRTARMQCFQDARTCFMNELPPRCSHQAGTGGSGASGAPASTGTGGA